MFRPSNVVRNAVETPAMLALIDYFTKEIFPALMHYFTNEK